MKIDIITRKNISRMPSHRYNRAFKYLGHETCLYDITEIPQKTDSDFVLFDDSGDMEIWPKLNKPCVYLGIDSALDSSRRNIHQGANMDIIFAAQKDSVSHYPRSKKIFWLANAHDLALNPDYKFQWQGRTQFAGAVGDFRNREDRIEFREAIEKLLSSGTKSLVKFDNSVKYEDMAAFYANTAVTINHNKFADINLRNFEAPSMGSILLVDARCHENGMEELGFEDTKNCLYYYNTDECLELLSHLLTRWYVDENSLSEIAYNGFKLVNDRHTYNHRAETMLQVLKEQL